MMVTGTTRVAAVIGDPVRHSMSPTIHNAAFASCRIDGVYVALPVAAGDAANAIDAMRTFGWFGLSVTMPHKHDIAAACDALTTSASELAAVNCVYWDGATIVGDNTDGQGFVRGLAADLDIDPSGSRCVVVGAGGAAKAVIRSLATAGADQVIVINRNAERASAAAALAGDRGTVGSPDSLPDADIVINATPVGMAARDSADADAVPFDPSLLRADAVVADLIYHPAETTLLKQASAHGLRCQNGLPMLVHQAVAQFEHWTGQRAPVDVMEAAVRASLAS